MVDVGKPAPSSSWPEWLTPRRMLEFVSNVVRLERAVESLENDNRLLRDEIRALERQVVENAAQLSLLTGFVRDALSAKVDERAEAAARRILRASQQNEN